MRTPLAAGDTIIRTLLREQWHLIPTQIHFIPMGDSAYSYRVETSSHNTYYLKIVDQRSATGRRTATHMNFSLPLQKLIAECHLPEVAAPLPQPTLQGACSASSGPLLFALYTFIQGETLADAYPMSPTLIRQIGQALAALHKVTLPAALQQQPPQDTLTKPFDAGLLADLASLEGISSRDAPYLQRLHELVWPRRDQIRAFQAHSQDYARQAQQTAVSLVVCHGDAWGGNIILAPSGQLTLLDWESAVMAPPERDAFIYMSSIDHDFSAFDAGYRLIHTEPMLWHASWLAYYGYRRQLRNLAQWLHNLLHEILDEVQRDNDVTMIEYHCLNRLEGVEQTAKELLTSLAR